MKKLLLSTAAIIGLAYGASPVGATLMISADINGTTFTCVDNAACDTNPAVGTLQIADQTIAGVSFLGSAQTQVIGGVNSLDTTSFQLLNTNATPATIQLAVSGTGFTGPVNTFSASGSGTFEYAPGNTGSNIEMSFTGDPTNTQGANTPTDLPGSSLANSGLLTAIDPTGTQAFSFGNNGPFVTAGLFSMSIGTSGLLEPGATLVGRSQAIVAQEVGVPEPSSLLLLSTAFFGLMLFGLKREAGKQAI